MFHNDSNQLTKLPNDHDISSKKKYHPAFTRYRIGTKIPSLNFRRNFSINRQPTSHKTKTTTTTFMYLKNIYWDDRRGGAETSEGLNVFTLRHVAGVRPMVPLGKHSRETQGKTRRHLPCCRSLARSASGREATAGIPEISGTRPRKVLLLHNCKMQCDAVYAPNSVWTRNNLITEWHIKVFRSW